ncbi:hypothetical protein NDU88_000446 [Pleurodeles waltl]|uniref:Uncharacterized protein n=1 Tax=Pleurodeles waltl TaxID=8319 RepID=A0AAV7SWK1_PLEWA|nr:hypothetical protein NDU88_000446 [Pleurodeles waltl]
MFEVSEDELDSWLADKKLLKLSSEKQSLRSREVTGDEILTAVRKLKRGKAAEPDGILKESTEERVHSQEELEGAAGSCDLQRRTRSEGGVGHVRAAEYGEPQRSCLGARVWQ